MTDLPDNLLDVLRLLRSREVNGFCGTADFDELPHREKWELHNAGLIQWWANPRDWNKTMWVLSREGLRVVNEADERNAAA